MLFLDVFYSEVMLLLLLLLLLILPNVCAAVSLYLFIIILLFPKINKLASCRVECHIKRPNVVLSHQERDSLTRSDHLHLHLHLCEQFSWAEHMTRSIRWIDSILLYSNESIESILLTHKVRARLSITQQ